MERLAFWSEGLRSWSKYHFFVTITCSMNNSSNVHSKYFCYGALTFFFGIHSQNHNTVSSNVHVMSHTCHSFSVCDASYGISVSCCRGYNIGVRLIEDFLARTQQGRCHDLKETADVLAKVCCVLHPYSCVWITHAVCHSVADLEGVPWVPWNPLFEGLSSKILYASVLCTLRPHWSYRMQKPLHSSYSANNTLSNSCIASSVAGDGNMLSVWE